MAKKKRLCLLLVASMNNADASVMGDMTEEYRATRDENMFLKADILTLKSYEHIATCACKIIKKIAM